MSEPFSASPGPASAPPTKKKGFPAWAGVLIGCGCFGLVGLTGIVAAILIPNFIDALQKAKQKRTVADVRNVGTAWLSWLTDEVSSSPAGSDEYFDVSEIPEILSVEDLAAILVPKHIQEVPALDGWGNPYDFRTSGDPQVFPYMSIRSPGRDGLYETDYYEGGPFTPTDYDQDIVWSDGYFIRWPGGSEP